MDRVCKYINSFNDTEYIITNKILGDGKSSTVFYGTHKINKNICVAIKRANIDVSDDHNIYFEAILLSQINYKGLPKFYGFYKDNNYYYIVMEYINGVNLVDYLNNYKKIDGVKLKRFSKQLVETVKYLHTNNIVHRDIKLENIMIDESNNRLVIIDFGFGGKITYNKDSMNIRDTNKLEQRFNNFCGSILYVAPEIWENKPYFGRPVDIWSLGVVIYTMSQGEFPYEDENNEDEDVHTDKDINKEDENYNKEDYNKEDINKENNKKTIYDNILINKINYNTMSKDLSNFIKSMLTIDPNKRVNINSLALSPFIKLL
jgi:serine/threonine protein kinase